MGRGRYVEAATYVRPEKVSGVVSPRRGGGPVVVRWPLPKPIPEDSGNIIERVAPQAGGRRTTVMVDDLEVGPEGESLTGCRDPAPRGLLRSASTP